MSNAKAIFSWPWRLVESGQYPDYDYTVMDARERVVAAYTGEDARAKAECIIVLAAEHQVRERAT